MNVTALNSEGGSELASFGSGAGSRAANARAAGPGGRRKISARGQAHVGRQAERLSAVGGRGARARRAELQAIVDQARNNPRRLTERQARELRTRLAQVRRELRARGLI